MGITVITYGGGEILHNMFNAIAMLMNSQSGALYKPLMLFSASLGGLWALTKLYFSPSVSTFLTTYFLPVLAISFLMMIPNSEVHIEDVLSNKSYKVDHVPILLARFAEMTSTIGYRVSRAFEKVMHTPNDRNYLATGMIFGSDASLDMRKYRITDANLEQNFRRFSKKCILYDVALGKYTLDDMKKNTNLLDFFSKKTSKVRMMPYCPPGENKGLAKCKYKTCHQAMEEMKTLFAKEEEYYVQHELFKGLPLTFQALTGLTNKSEKIISQQLVMNTISDEYSSNSFAKARAHEQQKNTYQIMGALAANSLISMRAVIEALVYAAFIFVMPLSLLPNGISYITKWMGLLIWIQMWPLFFSILSYVMQTIAQSQAVSVFYGLDAAQQGLSFFTYRGLSEIHGDIHALAGYLSASIPFLSYSILQGGAQSFIHLAGSMMTPAHSAATMAAAEQSSGNYSFANMNYGGSGYMNRSALQNMGAPCMSQGYRTTDYGNLRATLFNSGEETVHQSIPSLRDSFTSSDTFNDSLTKANSDATSLVDSSRQSLHDGITQSTRNLAELSDSMSKNKSLSLNYSQREATDLQNSFQHIERLANQFSNIYGVDSRDAMGLMVSVGSSGGAPGALSNLIAGVNFNGKGSVDSSVSHSEALSRLETIANDETFQKSFNQVETYAKNESLNVNNEQGMRAARNFSLSLDETRSSLKAYDESLSHQKTISESVNQVRSFASANTTNWDQAFSTWATHELYEEGGATRFKEILSEKQYKGDLDNLRDRFMNEVISPALSSNENLFNDKVLENLYASSNFNPVDASKGKDLVNDHYNQEKAAYQTTAKKETSDRLISGFDLNKGDVGKILESGRSSINNEEGSLSKHFIDEYGKSNTRRTIENNPILGSLNWAKSFSGRVDALERSYKSKRQFNNPDLSSRRHEDPPKGA